MLKRREGDQNGNKSNKKAKCPPPLTESKASFVEPFSPEDYAAAVFGEAVCGEDIPDGEVSPSRAGRTAKDVLGSKQWNNATQRVINTLSAFNIEAEIPPKKSFVSNCGGARHYISPAPKGLDRVVRFFCSRCNKKDKATLVAVGYCRSGEKGEGNYLQMTGLFPHNSTCQKDCQTDPEPYRVVDYDYDIVIGKKNYETELQEIDSQVQGSEELLGSVINFAKHHDSDDRSYYPLNCSNTDSTAHRKCMIRLFLHMAGLGLG
jgi:hypothetical protein